MAGEENTNIKTWKSGEPLKAPQLNELTRSILGILIGGEGILVEGAGDKIVVSNAQREPVESEDLLFAKVVDVKDDYLECIFVDPVSLEGTKTVNVAKPFGLRKTPFHNKKVKYCDGKVVSYSYVNGYQRTATVESGGTGSYTEKITPAYYKESDNTADGYIGHGEPIAIKRADTGIDDDSGEPVAYVEHTETNGRDWAVDL